MRKVFIIFFFTSFYLLSCSTGGKEPIQETSTNESYTEDSMKENKGLMEWASFFHNFTESLESYSTVKDLVAIPAGSLQGKLKEEKNLSEANFSVYFPKSFKEVCQQANKELSQELKHFELNKLYKFTHSESGYYKLLIEYSEKEVKVTHFRPIPSTKGQFEQILYLFSKTNSTYKLISITQ